MSLAKGGGHSALLMSASSPPTRESAYLRKMSKSSYASRLAESASSASSFRRLKNASLCPWNNPIAVKKFAAATAPAFWVNIGLMTEQTGRSALMNSHGVAKIWFVSLGPALSVPSGGLGNGGA